MGNLKYNADELIDETGNRITGIENRFVIIWTERKGGVGSVVSRCKLLHIEWMDNKALLCSTRNHKQYPLINHSGR